MQPMAAGPYHPAKVEPHLPVYVQPKLDGIRMFVRDGVAYTRSLKEVRSEQVQEYVSSNAEILEGLDGEVIAGEPTADDCYRRTASSVMSFNKPDDITFHVFDIWNSDQQFIRRLSHLENLSLPSFCSLVEAKLVGSIKEIDDYQHQLLESGHEGVIIRNPKGLYKFGRGTATKCDLIKMKKFIDAEARIVGFEEFMHNENTASVNELGYTERSSHKENLIPGGKLGALLAVGEFEDGSTYNVRIGTGFDMAQRQEIWDNRDKYLGSLVKFKYFPTGGKVAPRHPVFLGIRDQDDLPPSRKQPSQTELF